MPSQLFPVLTANDHQACDEKKACDRQSNDAQGLIVYGEQQQQQQHSAQDASGGFRWEKERGQMSHRS